MPDNPLVVQRTYDKALERLAGELPDYYDGRSITVRFDGSDTPYCFVGPDGAIHGRDLPATADVELATVKLADRLQDDVIETWLKVWPSCPGHEHPMGASLVDGRAQWVCPDSGTAIRAVGGDSGRGQ
jgi:hypothetical protein